ncbi:DUF2059 domain-containing protein [Halopseudomonas salegens]|uniref:DUF2059 domain-containing protein n=1 Tax=Halopseudomonas salegens TaxID=1434072 RepID=A0A1H2FXF1_9GAMM|nr:DUF2059 domain-containing protein [Halopseudomonas salegens]SDU12054.1 hypothetical protein SAMN05216210_1877 [Halopseudomonas salegens]
MARLFSVSLLLAGLWLSSSAFADAGHRASAERFLKLAKAESMAAPLYQQVSQLLTRHFTEAGGSFQYESILREHQELARARLDQQLAWEVIKDDLIDIYLPVFTAEEFEQLADFYQSEVGQKLMENLPRLSSESMALAQQRWDERLAEEVQQVLDEMDSALKERQPGPRETSEADGT